VWGQSAGSTPTIAGTRQSRWFSWAGGFAVFDDLLRRRFADHTNGRYKFDGGAMRGSHNSAFDPQTLVLLVTAFDEACGRSSRLAIEP
jgi:hypothetical protein